MKITNLQTGNSITFGGVFKLSKIDWGAPPVTHTKTKGNEQIGNTIDSTTVDARTVTLTGYIKMNGAPGIERRKAQLSSVVNPYQHIRFEYNGKRIDGKPTGTVKPATDRADNNRNLMKFTFSCLCEYPFFLMLNDLRKDVALWVGGFEFPLVIDVEEGIEFSTRSQDLYVIIENTGDVPIGMLVLFSASGTVPNPSITNMQTREFIAIDRTMEAGDVIQVSTHFDNIDATLFQDMNEENIINDIRPGSSYSMGLAVGDNILRYAADSNEDLLEAAVIYNPPSLMPFGS